MSFLEKEALLLIHTYIFSLSLSLCRYIYFYIYFVFFLLSTLFFILSLPDFGTHSFYHIHSHILTHTHSSSLSGNTLNYIYIYCIYIKVHGLSIRSNSQCIFSPYWRTIFFSLSAIRSPRYEKRDISCIFRILRNTILSLARRVTPKYRILSCTYKLSDVSLSLSRIVASRSRVNGGRRKDKKYCRRRVDPPSRRMCAKRFIKQRRNFSLPPSSTNVISDHTLVNELPSASKCLLNQMFTGLYV